MDTARQQAAATGDEPVDLTQGQDLRAEQRLKLMMMRAAKLAASEAETVCIIRDVSEHGVRLRVFHPLPADSQFELQLANGDTYVAHKMWEREGEAGFQFDQPIDVGKFIAEAGPYPKRQIRLRTKVAAVLTCDGISTPAVIRDLSQEGASIECPFKLALNQQIKLETEGMPVLVATVRWRSHPNYGVSFQNFFRMDEFAKLSWAIRTPGGTGTD